MQYAQSFHLHTQEPRPPVCISCLVLPDLGSVWSPTFAFQRLRPSTASSRLSSLISTVISCMIPRLPGVSTSNRCHPPPPEIKEMLRPARLGVRSSSGVMKRKDVPPIDLSPSVLGYFVDLFFCVPVKQSNSEEFAKIPIAGHGWENSGMIRYWKKRSKLASCSRLGD
jgi:hypothetical protein